MATEYVDFTTNLGDVVIQLFPDIAPQTVANFLSYAQNPNVGSGYLDSFFHRLATGFVLQGGGYYVAGNGNYGTIATNASVQNEYSLPNIQGSVAMAKVSNDPNSATDQFFINLTDNSTALNASNNGGYTVFGQVTTTSWSVVQQIAALPVYTQYAAPFDQFPYEGTYTGSGPTTANAVEVTNVSMFTACYLTGTALLTECGGVAVEALRPGDRLACLSGRVAAIRWIGKRSIDITRHPRPWDVNPVRVRADAFGSGMPARDLLLSPDHAVFTQGVLIPIRHLINDATIRQESAGEVTYWHVELDRHDIILAEGLPAESYLDTGNRNAFDDAPAPALHPSFGPHDRAAWSHTACAELLEHGALLDAVRASLAAQAVRLGQPVPEALELRVAGSGYAQFAVPAGVGRIVLMSDSGVPDGESRCLGAAVTRIVLDGETLPLDSAALVSGFHEIEGEDPWRWSNGRGVLLLAASDRPRLLEIDVTGMWPVPAARHAA